MKKLISKLRDKLNQRTMKYVPFRFVGLKLFEFFLFGISNRNRKLYGQRFL